MSNRDPYSDLLAAIVVAKMSTRQKNSWVSSGSGSLPSE